MQSPLLKVVNVTKVYNLGDTQISAVNGVSFEIYSGEFVAIVGKSGSGKSTLMHMIGLLDTPSSGQIYLNGEDVSKLSEKNLAKIRNKEIGFVFQSFNLLPRVSSIENVYLPLQYSSIPRKYWKDKAVAMLNLVELGNRLNNKSNELSGGQKQRVAIARALINDPAILLADEPTGNLDSKTGEDIQALFLKLHSQGKTIILVTHDDDLAKIAKRQIIMKDGVIVDA